MRPNRGTKLSARADSDKPYESGLYPLNSIDSNPEEKNNMINLASKLDDPDHNQLDLDFHHIVFLIHQLKMADH